MNVFLWVDLLLLIGFGYIICCLNFVKVLEKVGVCCLFILKDYSGNILDKIKQEGFFVEVIVVVDKLSIYISDEKLWFNGS